MSHSAQHDDYRARWWFFIGVEIVLVLAWFGLFIAESLSLPFGNFADVCFWALVISIVLLLFVLPWFWATLRYVALIGWMMGAASALYLLLNGPAHR